MAKGIDRGYLPPDDPMFHEPWTITPMRPGPRRTPTVPSGEAEEPEEPAEEKQDGE
jgi:hypothetical protein